MPIKDPRRFKGRSPLLSLLGAAAGASAGQLEGGFNTEVPTGVTSAPLETGMEGPLPLQPQPQTTFTPYRVKNKFVDYTLNAGRGSAQEARFNQEYGMSLVDHEQRLQEISINQENKLITDAQANKMREESEKRLNENTAKLTRETAKLGDERKNRFDIDKEQRAEGQAITGQHRAVLQALNLPYSPENVELVDKGLTDPRIRNLLSGLTLQTDQNQNDLVRSGIEGDILGQSRNDLVDTGVNANALGHLQSGASLENFFPENELNKVKTGANTANFRNLRDLANQGITLAPGSEVPFTLGTDGAVQSQGPLNPALGQRTGLGLDSLEALTNKNGGGQLGTGIPQQPLTPRQNIPPGAMLDPLTGQLIIPRKRNGIN